MRCAHVGLPLLAEQVIYQKDTKTKKKRILKMTEKNVYSRAYHKELYKSGVKVQARKLGNQAVEEWLQQQQQK